MSKYLNTTFSILMAALSLILLSSSEQTKPKAADMLQPVTLRQTELSGEIGRRINDLIYKNYMALDLDSDFIIPFRVRPFTEGYHYTGAGKVIDAGSLFTAYTEDPKVAGRTSNLINDIIETHDPDGYIGIFKPEPEAHQNHHKFVLHEQEYLLLGLTRNWLVTQNKNSLQRAQQIGDYIIATFSKDERPEEVCTAGLPEAFLLLYRCTNDERYLKFAAEIRHGYAEGEIQCASLLNWDQDFDGKKDPNHAYVNLARCYAQTELYRYMRNPTLLAMSRKMRHELLRPGGALLVTGSTSDYEGFSYMQNGTGAVVESCVTAYLLRWLESMMRLDGDLRYGDIMERTIYNALFAAQDPEGRKIRYFTPFTGPRIYSKNDGYCCPGNYRRIVAELPQKVCYRDHDNTIVVNLFTTSQTTIALNPDLSVTLTQNTDYPNSGHIVFHVKPSKRSTFALQFRIPRWCQNASAKINGKAPAVIPSAANHYEIRRTWETSDTVTLELPMKWRFIKGHQLQEGKAALVRGPVVYCLGTAQNEEVLKKYPNFKGIVIDPDSPGEPELDTSVRPDGRKVTVKVRVEAPAAPHETLTFTEFIDPTGIITYFPLLDLSKAEEDELMADCFAKTTNK